MTASMFCGLWLVGLVFATLATQPGRPYLSAWAVVGIIAVAVMGLSGIDAGCLTLLGFACVFLWLEITAKRPSASG
ncbi:MAG TPA: hypothetical protein VGO52_25925 [Hyphomonadaceae bacterium]|jgi:hypothetical protein|nr:hypothetical protein [Hyphomonadaceae bacterium]